MKAMTNQEFAAQVAELAKKAGPPQATAVYDPDGDCIEFLARPEPFYGERIDDLITVYYSQETHEGAVSVGGSGRPHTAGEVSVEERGRDSGSL